MDYKELYDNNKEKFNKNEKKYVGQILDLLSQKEVTIEIRQNYGNRLKDLLIELDNLDKDTAQKKEIIDNEILILYNELKTELDELVELSRHKIVQDKINKVITECNSLKGQLDGVQNTLSVTEETNITSSEIFKHINGISNLIKLRMENIDNFIENYEISFYYLDYSYDDKKINEFKDAIKRIKLKQIDGYNSLIKLVNERISKLKEMHILDDDVNLKLQSLELLPFCNDKGIRYNSKKYLENIDYKRLIDTFTVIDELEKKFSLEEKTNLSDAELRIIEGKIASIKDTANNNLSLEDANKLKEDIQNTVNILKDLRIRIINDNDHKEYLKSIFDYEEYLKKLVEQTEANLKKGNKIDDYQELKRRIIAAVGNIDNIDTRLAFLTPLISRDGLSELEQQLDECKNELGNIEGEILEKNKQGIINNIQYQNLDVRLNEAKIKLKELMGKLQDPSIMKNTDVFENLNAQIDNLPMKIDSLNRQIVGYDIINDNNLRRKIDEDTQNVWDYVANALKYLEMHKNEDSEKYNLALAKVEDHTKELTVFSNEYHEKCPLRVKNVKSTKEFYKKHKKVCLISGGVAALALISAVVGPVIIPAIMRGNMIIGYRIPGLRKMVVDINKVLGASIGAKVVNHTWILSNGIPLSVSVASASMLKAVALVGGYSAALTSALILGVKKIISKMNLSNLKNKLLDVYDSFVDKVEQNENEYDSSKKR